MGYRQTNINDLEDSATLRDPEAFSGLVRLSYNLVYLTALAMTSQAEMAEDIAQETFLRAWMKRDLVTDPAAGLQPWLVRIARNLSTDWLRTGQQRSRVLPLLSLEELIVEPADPRQLNPRQSASQAEQNTQIADAVMTMPDDLRQVVLLHYAEGMSASDIARMNGEAPSTVTRRLDRARAQLRAQLESGMAAGLAMMKPGPRSLEKTLGLLGAAAALPAATRAQLIQSLADTPPPLMIDPVTSAAHAAQLKEAGIMANFIVNAGAAKLLAGVAAVAVIGGGVFTVRSLSNDDGNSSQQVERSHEQSARISSIPTKSKSPSGLKRNALVDMDKSAERSAAGDADSSSGQSRKLRPDDRIALLENDTISTHPKISIADGETTERIYFDMQVVDESGLPVKDAKIKIYGLRGVVRMNQGSRGFRSEKEPFSTNEQGIARVWAPRYYQEKLETGGILATVFHPDYATTSADLKFTDFKKVVLKRGRTLTVFAHDERSSTPITSGIDINPAHEWDWGSGGAMIIRKINQDEIGFYLRTTGDPANVKVSDYQLIKFPRESDEPIHVALRETYRVFGSLSSNVVRPVKNGKVIAAHVAGDGQYGSYQMDEVDINEDGTFELNGMPKGEIMIWALADGWSSVHVDRKKRQGSPLRFTLDHDEQQYVLPMEQTATAILKLVDESGQPVEGVSVGAAPNMCYEGVCGFWIRFDFVAESNSDGIAVIPDLPPLPGLIVGSWADKDWQFPTRQSSSDNVSRDILLDMEPGQATERTVTVYPAGTTVITRDGDKITTAVGAGML